MPLRLTVIDDAWPSRLWGRLGSPPLVVAFRARGAFIGLTLIRVTGRA
jgi:hypothetical protein